MGDIGRLTCSVKDSHRSALYRISWKRALGVNNVTAIVSQTIIKNQNKSITSNASGNRFDLDRSGTLTIHNLTLEDSGYYTCLRTGKMSLIVKLDVIGKLFVEYPTPLNAKCKWNVSCLVMYNSPASCVRWVLMTVSHLGFFYWINFNPSMNKLSHAQYSLEWNLVSIAKLQRLQVC